MKMLEIKPPREAKTTCVAASERERARRRLEDRRDFGSHAIAFVVVNAFLLGVWAVIGSGYFWPAWVLAAWGVGLVLHGWDAFIRRPITEHDVDREVEREYRQKSDK
jgi:fatty acid desaturase